MYKIKLVIISFYLFSNIACSQENKETIVKQKPISGSDNPNNAIEARQFVFPSSKYVMVAAHRAGGLNNNAPENSLSAIQRCLNLGVDIIELDVRITLDNNLIVMHDKTLDRTTNGSGKVSHYKLEEIKKLFLKDRNGAITDERVITLEEALIAIGNKAIVFIDKSEFVLNYVIPILNKTNSVSNALFMDFIEFKDAEAKYGNLLKKAYYIPAIHDSNPNFNNYFPDFIAGFHPNPTSFAFWFKKESSKSFSYIESARNSNIPIWINTSTAEQSAGHTDEVSLTNPDQGWGWVLNQGANIILTDEPEALIKYLKSKGLR